MRAKRRRRDKWRQEEDKQRRGGQDGTGRIMSDEYFLFLLILYHKEHVFVLIFADERGRKGG